MIRAPSAGNEQNRNIYVFNTKAKVNELDNDTSLYYKKLAGVMNNPQLRVITIMTMANKDYENVRMRNRGIAELDKKERKRIFKKMMVDLSEKKNTTYYKNASAAVIVTSNTNTLDFHKSFYKADIAIAITCGIIMAGSLGLASCWMGLSEIAFNKDKKLKAKYQIPRNERVDGILAIGYSDLEWKQIPPRGPVKVVWT
jgi:nitroreductase